MAHRTELNAKIAELTGVSRHIIDRIGVNLNKSGIIRSGGRGRHAPAMKAEDLKTIILALLGSESTGKVFKTVLKYHGLENEGGEKFGDVLLGLCSGQDEAAKVMQISVLRNYPQASIYWKDESGVRVGKIQNFEGETEEEQLGLRVVATINGSVLAELVKLVLTTQPTESDHLSYLDL